MSHWFDYVHVFHFEPRMAIRSSHHDECLPSTRFLHYDYILVLNVVDCYLFETMLRFIPASSVVHSFFIIVKLFSKSVESV